MENESNNSSKDFLQTDFELCLEQAKYYDTQISDIFKFLISFYTGAAGITVGLYQFSSEKGVDIRLALILGLSVTLLFGILILPSIVRNRVYFVKCMRYVNEIRAQYLLSKPLGFVNNSRMYTQHDKPSFYNVFSTQSGWIYVLSILNTFILGIMLYIAKTNLAVDIVSCSFLLLSQNIAAIWYLKSQK
jgi:hypothetical protein